MDWGIRSLSALNPNVLGENLLHQAMETLRNLRACAASNVSGQFTGQRFRYLLCFSGSGGVRGLPLLNEFMITLVLSGRARIPNLNTRRYAVVDTSVQPRIVTKNEVVVWL